MRGRSRSDAARSVSSTPRPMVFVPRQVAWRYCPTGRNRNPAIPPSTASAVPVTDAAVGEAR